MRRSRRASRFHGFAVDLNCVIAADIAERTGDAVLNALEDEPSVARVLMNAERHAQLEGHVEAWHPVGKLHAREIVDRRSARADDGHQPCEARVVRGLDLEHAPWRHAERRQTGDDRDVQWGVTLVERNVQEDLICASSRHEATLSDNAKGDAAGPALATPCG